MSKHLRVIIAVILLSVIGCKKEDKKPECATWVILYWQGDGNHKTIVSDYQPYNRDETLCGAENSDANRGKIVEIRKVSPGVYDYKTYAGRR